MKDPFLFRRVVGAICLLSGLATASAAETHPVFYAVDCKEDRVATQTVTIVKSAELTTVTTSFEAELPVFVVLHQYTEKASATFRSDGTVVRLNAYHSDGGSRTEVTGELQTNGLLRVVRTDMEGISTNFVARKDYDFNSLILYGTAPADFLPTNSPARVLQIDEGRVEDVAIQTISESFTFERQNLASTHLIWTAGPHTSHSWHPERFSNLPRQYVRQTKSGEFTFTLLR